jgi:glycosyltransferase involved in cell wall biosynthesis
MSEAVPDSDRRSDCPTKRKSASDQRRIAIVLATLGEGGAERIAINLADGFVKRGHQVDLVVVRPVGPLVKVVPPGVRVVDLKAGRARAAIRSLRSYIRDEGPDVLLAINYEANFLTLLSSIGLREKARTILTVHCGPHQYIGTLSLRTRLLYLAAIRLLYPAADAIVAVSHGIEADFKKLGIKGESIRTIYNPVLRDDFDELARAEVDHDWFRKAQGPVIVTVGRLTLQKDHRLLLRSFQRLASPHARLMIIGDGELRTELEREAAERGLSDRVFFAGYRDNPYPYMQSAQLFVLSSRWEGLPTVLIEAMATGTPVVSTDCPHGPREILEDGRWGALVPVGDVDALAKAMSEILDHGGVNAAERAGEFGVEAAAKKYLALFASAGR